MNKTNNKFTNKTKKIKYFKLGLIFSVSIAFISYILLNYFTLNVIERGPRLYFFLLFLELTFLLCSVILGFFWINTKYGFKKAKFYVIGISFCVIIILSGVVISNNQQRKEYSYITIDNIQRQYIVHLPTNYNDMSSYPILLALHGGSGNAKQFEDQSEFNRVADKYHFIVVYPDGLGLFEFNFHVWNSGYIGTNLNNGVNDVSFLYHLIMKLQTDYSINSSRIYMTGHSNGAMMSYRMAAEYPELFAGVAPVSGSIGGKMTPESNFYEIPKPNGSVNILAIHGKQDTNVLYNGGVTQTGFNAGERYDLSVNDSISFWIKNNNCTSLPITQNSTNNELTMESFTGGINNTFVKLVTINPANHFWENMNKVVSEEEFHGSFLAEMIWNLLTE